VLPEYGILTGEPLTDIQARALQQSRALTLTPTAAQPGRWDVRAAQYVGVVRLADVDVWIVPKVPVDRLMYLITYARSDRGWERQLGTFAVENDLFASVAFAFAHHAEAAINGGILQGYITVEESLPGLRGRLREADQMRRRFGLAIPLEVVFDDYTTDIVENRLLRSAARQLLQLPRLAPLLARRLRRIIHHLDGVNSATAQDRSATLRFTRLNERYRPVTTLARIILDCASLHFAEGAQHGVTFVLDMNKVFEDFVTSALGEELERIDGHALAQQPSHLDHDQKIEIKPDLLWCVNQQTRCVIDVKYKSVATAESPNADVYQALAYCIAHNVRRGYLIYAAGDEQPTNYRIVNTDRCVSRVALDLGQSPDRLLAEVRRVAEEIGSETLRRFLPATS
jgi:5-methylcytosine-specific restriction enzyme subunit McrC